MSRLQWDERPYALGVDRGVLYPSGIPGVPWHGLISVTENPSEDEITANYYDGNKYHLRRGAGEFFATIEAYTYPDEFEALEGLKDNMSAQFRQEFGLSYRTMLEDGHYEIHLIYNALAAPSSRSYQTRGDSVEPINFSWDIATIPEEVPGAAPSAHLVITTKSYSPGISLLEDLLYGTEIDEPRLPSPTEIYDLFESQAILQIIDHGDGTWTAIGPDSVVQMLDDTTFQIDWPSVVYISADTYRVMSM